MKRHRFKIGSIHSGGLERHVSGYVNNDSMWVMFRTGRRKHEMAPEVAREVAKLLIEAADRTEREADILWNL